jgi:hypothetical protein
MQHRPYQKKITAASPKLEDKNRSKINKRYIAINMAALHLAFVNVTH